LKVISKRWAGALVVTLVLVAGGIGTYLFLPKQVDLTNVNVVTGLVSKHIMLPNDETPALLTVTDTSKLTTDFLKQASNGDKVLIYQKHKKAIIYRPSIDRIVDVGPVVIDDVSGGTK